MPPPYLRDLDDQKDWIRQIAGASMYLRGLYQRLGDPAQATRADRAGQMAQEQLSRVTLNASTRMVECANEFRQIEWAQGDQTAEQAAWKSALIGLLAIAIWAGVADAMEERNSPSSVCRRISRALEVALDAAKTAFTTESRKPLMEEMERIAVDRSIEGLTRLAGNLGPDGESIVAVMEEQVRRSVRKYLSAWDA